MKDKIDLSICIVNWNAGQFLLDCLASIKRDVSELKYEVIIADNASTDDSIMQIRAIYPWAKLIMNEQNSGFAKGCNIAIAYSSGRYILLLNPDTLIYSGALKKMVNFMDTNQQVGACGPCLIHPDSDKVDISARNFPKFLPLLWNLSYLDRLLPHSSVFGAYLMNYREKKEQCEVDWVSGACLMVRREAVEQIGGLDENFFMYCEDTDLCYVLKQAGWKIFYLPKVRVAHYKGKCSKLKMDNLPESQLSPWATRQYTRSILYFYNKHYDYIQSLFLRIVIVITGILKALIWLFGGTIKFGWKIGRARAYSYLSMIPEAISYTCFSKSS